ncbi:D-alanyl-D-alanine carboxypeptidase family protein [Vallitalea guaymasensis]|uniref:serine-type D-Ala-D-Ala carboxypeptidase n=1 Tax=Vallitalea guaymasensis TaxID=1185412 RepID=A0A8J8SEQ7_9FIRM|nr:D-alanyl-D-alanine carboxypeptidase family protein [Vallitalea guaymasensis]QUH31796.1 D-alanyl-D-alanine carboxypeptidase [Vallitalea guaymasensis]
MKKRIFCYLLSLALFMGGTFNVYVHAEEEPKDKLELTAKSAILMEPTTGKILYEKNSHERLRPASITKIMTLLLMYEALENGKIGWEDEVVVSEHASSFGGSTIFLETNEVQPVKELAKGIAVASGNDAAVAMAEHIAGTEGEFVNMMNAKAKELGMKDTNFVNACGLDADGHLTSAYDIAIMSKELTTKYPQVYDLTKIWMDKIVHQRKDGEEISELTSTNKLLKWYPEYATGLKTGSTSLAKYCLSGTANKDGLNLIAVVMATPNHKERFREVMKMLDYGFANCKMYKDAIKDKTLANVPVKKGTLDSIDCVGAEDFSCILDSKEQQEITNDIQVEEFVEAPIAIGDKIGEIVYKCGEKEVGRVDLVAANEVPKATLGFYLGKILKMFFH